MTIYPRFVSGISRYYNQCFVLNKEDLQRIHSVLDSAAARLNTPVVQIFRVEREDDRFYETDSIDQVFSDPNIENSRIVGLSLELCYTEPRPRLHPHKREWIVHLQFRRKKKMQLNDSNAEPAGVNLQISVENRDWALLLADDLEPQVKRTFKAKYTPRWLLWSLLIPVAIFVIKLIYSNDLFSDFWPISPDLGVILATLVLALAILFQILNSNLKISGPPTWFSRWFGPESGFLWGDELQEYSNREQTRQNIMWGVVIHVMFRTAKMGPVWAKSLFLFNLPFRISDCGFRNENQNLRLIIRNPQSAIRNLQLQAESTYSTEFPSLNSTCYCFLGFCCRRGNMAHFLV